MNEMNEMNSTIENFRNGIFALKSRRFGTVAEIMIKRLYGLEDSHSIAFDKLDKNGKRIEVKFATVMSQNNETIKDDNIINEIIKANANNRIIKYFDLPNHKFNCGILQIKASEFDELYYGLFFADKIEIFKMSSKEVLNYKGYSNKQHRNSKDEGQFHITHRNINFHRKHFLQKTLTYEELFELLNQ